MNIDSILALTDFSAGADRALERAARLAADHGALLRVAYLTDRPGHRLADRLTRLSQRAQQLAREHRIHARGSQRHVSTIGDLIEQAGRADLLVLDPLADHRFGGLWRRAALPQVIAHSPCPVLVVRNERAHAYAKTLLAFDPVVDPRDLVRYASDFETDSSLEVLRIEKRRSSAEAPRPRIPRSLVARAVRNGRRAEGNRSFRLTDPLENRKSRLLAALGQVDAVAQILNEQDYNGADLVVAARQAPALVDTILNGDFAQRLARGLRCDLLLVPHGHLDRSAELAAGRMRGLGCEPASGLRAASGGLAK